MTRGKVSVGVMLKVFQERRGMSLSNDEDLLTYNLGMCACTHVCMYMCMVCGHGMWAWYVGMVCGHGMWAWYVCMACVHGMCAWYACKYPCKMKIC